MGKVMSPILRRRMGNSVMGRGLHGKEREGGSWLGGKDLGKPREDDSGDSWLLLLWFLPKDWESGDRKEIGRKSTMHKKYTSLLAFFP